MANEIDYNAVLADMEAKRAAPDTCNYWNQAMAEPWWKLRRFSRSIVRFLRKEA